LLTAPDPTVRAQATSVLVELSIHHPLELRSTSEAILARLDDVVAAPIEQRKLRTRLEDRSTTVAGSASSRGATG
jgi:hypothetical protein